MFAGAILLVGSVLDGHEQYTATRLKLETQRTHAIQECMKKVELENQKIEEAQNARIAALASHAGNAAAVKDILAMNIHMHAGTPMAMASINCEYEANQKFRTPLRFLKG